MKSIFLTLWLDETSQDSAEMAIVVAILGLVALLVARFSSNNRHLAFAAAIFKPDVPSPQVVRRQFSEIVDVHPAVLQMIEGLATEPIGGLIAVSDELIDDVYGFPRIAVVPVRAGSGFWCCAGVKAYLRLLDRGWRGKVAMLDYGSRMSEQKIVKLAYSDWVYGSAITGAAQSTDWACAQVWEANTDYICKPVKSRNFRPSGLKTFAVLRGLSLWSLRADKKPKESKSINRPRITANDNVEEGSKG
jgi:hypothetical protein